MAVGLTISADGEAVWENHLAESSQRARNLRPAFARLVPSVFRFFRRRFDTSGRYGGGPWQPKKESTLRTSRSSKPLFDSGALRRAFTSRSPDNVTNITDDFLEIGTTLEYATFHQTGYKRASVSVPPRPILPGRIPDREGEQWGRFLMEYVTNG